MLPVIIAASAPDNLALAADWGGEGWFRLPAVLEIRIPVDGVEDGNGLLDQALRLEAPVAILLARHRPALRVRQRDGSNGFGRSAMQAGRGNLWELLSHEAGWRIRQRILSSRSLP
jgi:hypothetical protein